MHTSPSLTIGQGWLRPVARRSGVGLGIAISHPRFQFRDYARVQLRKGKAFPSKVLERGAEEEQTPVVDDQESVVKVLARLYREAAILRVESIDVAGLEPVSSWRCDNLDGHPFVFLAQQFQRRKINPTIDQDNRLAGVQDVLSGKDVRIEYLPVEEYALYRRETRLHEEVHLLLQLGNLYWELGDYIKATPCYHQLVAAMDKEEENYTALQRRSIALDHIEPHLSSIHLQDSLQALARMPETERLAAIDRVIAELRKQEKEAERQAANGQTGAATQTQTTTVSATPTPAGRSSRDGSAQFYFYTPTAVMQGKQEFQRQWGRRANQDLWRFSNRETLSLLSPEQETTEQADSLKDEEAELAFDDEASEAGADTLANDPHNREYYLAQIPFSEEQKAASHAIIQEALLRAGIIFKDKLDNLKLSEKHLLRLTKDYPDYEHMDDAWYHLFLLYSRRGQHTLADNCLSHLKAEHPQSEWTTLLNDPYYASNAKFGTHIEDSLYAATYEAFKADKYDEVKGNTHISENRFPMGENRAKFIFIDGLSRLNEGDGQGCIERLKEVVEKHPKSEVAELAGMIIKGVQDGRRLHGGKFDIGDVWSRRDVTLTADSTVADTLSADPHQHFLFILAYEPDSMDQNQLLFEMARYNFTNFLVRNFEISTDTDNGLQRMLINGFQNYDEALQYARRLYADETMAEAIKNCRTLIISDVNLALLGTRFSYEDYEVFYEDTFVPMKISSEQLLIQPAEIEAPDIEDTGGPAEDAEQNEEEGDEEEEDDVLPGTKQQKKKVTDFDFGDDFW
mgnify:CR=1 FL=1